MSTTCSSRETHDPLSRLSAVQERNLRRRLARWSGRSLGLPEAEFADAYQSAWRKSLVGISQVGTSAVYLRATLTLSFPPMFPPGVLPLGAFFWPPPDLAF